MSSNYNLNTRGFFCPLLVPCCTLLSATDSDLFKSIISLASKFPHCLSSLQGGKTKWVYYVPDKYYTSEGTQDFKTICINVGNSCEIPPHLCHAPL